MVGLGIQYRGHITAESLGFLTHSESLLYLANDKLSVEWLEAVNPSAESLEICYRDGLKRRASYDEMVERILAPLRQGKSVCVALYGHPGVFVNPSHEAIETARAEGFRAQMLPGISAEDCLFADVGFDPAAQGCSSFEATDFLLRHRVWDPTSALVLWQVGCIGDPTFRADGYDLRNLEVLTERLLESYPPEHEVVVYQATLYPVCKPTIERLPLSELPRGPVTAMSTLLVPPLPDRPTDKALWERLQRSITEAA